MIYQFTITTTDSKLFKTKYNFKIDTLIIDVKRELVGPLLTSIGPDKIRIYQKKIFNDLDDLREINHLEPVLIYPLIPSIRTLIIDKFKKRNELLNFTDESFFDNLPVSDNEPESDNEPDFGISYGEIDSDGFLEEKVELETKKFEEVISNSKKTLELFKKNHMLYLLKIYYENKTDFMEFLDFIVNGDIIIPNSQEKKEYPVEFIKDIKESLCIFNDYSEEDIIRELNKFDGNLGLMLSSKLVEN